MPAKRFIAGEFDAVGTQVTWALVPGRSGL